MLFINATPSKNHLYKHENQISKVPTISKQDDIIRVLFQISLHVVLLMSAIYFRVIMVGFWFAATRVVMLKYNDKLFWKFS